MLRRNARHGEQNGAEVAAIVVPDRTDKEVTHGVTVICSQVPVATATRDFGYLVCVLLEHALDTKYGYVVFGLNFKR